MTANLRGNIRVYRRKNKDKTLTYYLRWQLAANAKTHNRRLFRTEPSPDKQSLKKWRRAARQAAFDLDDEILGPAGRHLYHLTLEQARDWYMVWIRGDDERLPEHTPRTCDAECRILTSFVEYVQQAWPKPKGWRVNSLSATHMSSCGQRELPDGTIEKTSLGWWRWRLATAGLAVSTVRTEVAIVRAWLRWCERHRYVDRAPDFVGPRAEPAVRPLIVEDHQVRALLAAALDQDDPLAAPVLFVLAATGMRQGELKDLKVRDFLPAERALSIPKHRRTVTKLHRRILPLGDRAAVRVLACAAGREPDAVLFSRDGLPLTWHIGIWMKASSFTPHDLRRWFSNHLIGWGCPQQWLDMLLGHVSKTVDSRYSNATLEELREWVERIDRRLS